MSALKTKPTKKIIAKKEQPNFRVASTYLDDLFDTKSFKKIINGIVKVISTIEYDAIAFRGHSGGIVASAVSFVTSKPLILIRKPSQIESSHTRGIHEGVYPRSGQTLKYIIIDDFISTGETVNEILKAMQAREREHNMSYTRKVEKVKIKCSGIVLYKTNRETKSHAGIKIYNVMKLLNKERW